MITKSSIQSVYIYTGHRVSEILHGMKKERILGPYSESVEKHRFIIHQLNERYKKNWKVEEVFGEHLVSILPKVNFSKTLLVIPAGESTKLDEVFTDEQITTIKKCVSQGLQLFATCGSAYWLSHKRIWNDKCQIQPDSQNTITKTSRFNIFDGTALGPLSPYPGEMYSTAFFHEAVNVETNKQKINVLLSGGGAFFPSGNSAESVTTLASYSKGDLIRFGKDTSWQNAVIYAPYGQGGALLSMIHPGYGAEDINIEAYQNAFPHRKDDWVTIKNMLSSLNDRMAFVEELFSVFEKPIYRNHL